ncbi:MAG: hypothetical protein NC078_02455 [Ruminococcus sp.]|nr:hypothetical protein [Ruminococcus sp.]
MTGKKISRLILVLFIMGLFNTFTAVMNLINGNSGIFGGVITGIQGITTIILGVCYFMSRKNG